MNGERDSELHDLAALHALDALEGEDRARFEEHLADCAPCRKEVASFREAASQLAVEDVPPPPSVRRAVLSQLGHTPQEAPESRRVNPSWAEHRGRGPEAEVDPAAQGATGDLPGKPVTGARRFSSLTPGRRRGRVIAVVAGLAVAASLLVVGVVQRPWEREDAPATAVEQVLEAQDAEHFEGDSADDTQLQVVYSPSQGAAVLRTIGLDEPPAGHVYQVWYLHDGADPVSAGTLGGGTGDEQVTLLDGDAAAATGVAITVEPAGGSQLPTTDPVHQVPFT